MADAGAARVIQGLTVEASATRPSTCATSAPTTWSEGNTVRNTGLRRDNYGEGIYIGTAESATGAPTPTARPTAATATSSAATPSRHHRRGHRHQGGDHRRRGHRQHLRRRGADGHHDSWVDVKGNGWLIKANTGHNSPEDGFQTHQILDGWGTATSSSTPRDRERARHRVLPGARQPTSSPATTASPPPARASATSTAPDPVPTTHTVTTGHHAR